MLTAPYRKDKPYDEYFEKLITDGVNKRLEKKDDDYLMFCTGVTGSGKTNLMFHAYELYDYENMSMEFVGLKRENFADALSKAKKYKGKRFVGYDEANINKRDSLTKWNKDLIDLYFAIRGMNIFHWWNNPSVDMIDKALVSEKINGLIFIFTKSNDKPRLYYFFTKTNLLEMLERYERLTINLLKDKGYKHATYIGWFKPYTGKIMEEYLAVKENRMESKIDDFHTKWGTKEVNDMMTVIDVASKCGLGASTIRFNHNKLVNEGKLIEGEHFVINPAGHRLYYDKVCEVFINNAVMNRTKVNKFKKKLIKDSEFEPIQVHNTDNQVAQNG